ncbi:MAG: trypsin-like peptidase domain-containing protein [Bacteroidia bacterium]|nr:trypsin-like peptidase domain-containing protein [Bacteroidia bacterium]MDW8015551.1 trypsin-like peptidase domain-containing protein [Bacteroidia bacterium]
MRVILGNVLVAVVASLTTWWLVRKKEPPSVSYIPPAYLQPARWEVHPPVDFTVAAQIAMPAVVHIRTRAKANLPSFHQFFLNEEEEYLPGSGSGVILSSDGYIVTCNHVIENATRIEVTLYDNRTFRASIVGTDPSTDLALLKIEATGLPYLEFGDSDQLRVGDWVLAVGNPFNLTSTVTAGIVSAKGRTLGLLREKNFPVESFIQTDAAVNPGNSGGALVNIEGKLVGINTAIASITGTFTGYSFAVPSTIARKVIEDLRNYGKVQRALLGVMIQNLTPELQKEAEVPVSQGIYVYDVFGGSAAEEAGIRVKDVIVEIDGRPVRSTAEMMELLAQHRPGDRVKIGYYRGSKKMETFARLKGRSSEEEAPKAEAGTFLSILGARVRPLTPEEKEALGVQRGIKVVEISPGPLMEVGVRPGFVITAIDRRPVSTPEEAEAILRSIRGGLLLEGLYRKGEKAYYAISTE